jgi:magnesium chelatase subunit D
MALARKLARKICASDEVIKALATAAMSLGVQSVRALHFALKVARINAALRGRDAVDAIDAALAVRLVLAPRATRLPSPPEEDLETESEHTEAKAGDADEDRSCPRDPPNETLEDSVLAAARVAIPPKLLEQLLSSNRPLRAQGGGTSGARQSDAKRGRRIGIRRGPNRSGRGLNVLATLRAAVPWQRLRTGAVTPHQKPSPSRDAIRILPEDFRLHRYQQRSDTLSIFVVDASGSQALHRLGEAKGAVELLLADCYVRRDRVAVIAFRGRDAQVLLPPTRSLARAKKSLAGLPGGGGTPLASGLDAAGLMVEAAHRRGETALVVLLTDGRANVARNGAGGRMQAEADALHAAHQMRQSAVASLVIDTSASGQAQAEAVAHAMNARYLPLPHADAHVMSRAVSTLVRERSERS